MASFLPTDLVREWRSNWRIGFASFLGMAFGGAFLPNIFSLFVVPLERQFGWSRAEIGFAISATLVSGIMAPLIGNIVDRKGVRKSLLTSLVLVVACWLALAAMPGNLWIFYLLFTALCISALPATGLGYTRITCETFVASRGISLAIVRAGLSLSALFSPLLLYWIITHYSWRAGYLTIALLVAGTALPAAWAWITRSDDSASGVSGAAVVAERPSMSFLHVIRNRRALILAVAAALAYGPMVAILAHAVPMLMHKHLTGELAAGLVGLVGLASLAGAVFTGAMLDRFWAPGVAAVMMACGVAGALMLALVPGGVVPMAVALILVGFAQGAENDICAYLVARYFGIRNYSSVFGVMILAISLAAAAGAPAMGGFYDKQGDYRMGLLVAAAAFALAGLAYLSLRRYPALPSD